MTREFIELGSTPCTETPLPREHEKSQIQARVFVEQIHRHLPDANVLIMRKSRTYYVAIPYEDSDPKDIDRAVAVEMSIPARWDVQALKELRNLCVYA